MPPELIRDDLRAGWLGVPQAYQPFDALGAAMGAYFIYAGATGRGPPWATIGLGAVMVYIHVQRFFYAPQTREGLIRLARALELEPADVEAIAAEL